MANARQGHGQPMIKGFSIVKEEGVALLVNRSLQICLLLLTQVVVGLAGMGSQMYPALNQLRIELARCST